MREVGAAGSEANSRLLRDVFERQSELTRALERPVSNETSPIVVYVRYVNAILRSALLNSNCVRTLQVRFETTTSSGEHFETY